MSNMGDTFTGTIVAASKTAGRHKGKTISGIGFVAIMSVLGFLEINPFNFVVENSSVFKEYKVKHWELYTKVGEVQAENERLRSELLHNNHIFESQNFILGVMLESDMITTREYRAMIHAVTHRRDSL